MKNEFQNSEVIHPSVSAIDQLERLAALKDKGTITEDEFQATKKQLLHLTA